MLNANVHVWEWLPQILDYYEKVQIQNEGGWKTYKTIPKIVGLKIVEVGTENGVIDVDKLSKSPLILCEPAGYITSNEKNVKLIRAKTDFLILDISGSIGKDYIKKFDADIVVCSFGDYKPLGIGYGGFFATNNEKIYSSLKELFECFKTNIDEKELLEKLEKLDSKYKMYEVVKKKVIKDIEKIGVELIFDKNGINIFAKIKSENEKKMVDEYLKKENIPFLNCPEYHRLNQKGISIEIKRM